ncbi:MAG: transcription elongation factor GreAB, partial [Opitutaceae bacterium]|nr:transcription elongation factor GreAB [Opitutaceae bacterium]
MNSEAVTALVVKNPSLKTSKAKLEAMEPGAYVVHRSWGFGQIKSYDDATQRLKIDFKGKKGHQMDPVFCVTTMDVLPANHLLVRKETDTKKINELIAENPAQLVVEALESYPNSAATVIEMEIVLAQVVGDDKFKKWWSVAKKAVAKDPRIAIPEKKTECYVLRETPISAEDEILEQFTSTRSARRRIALAEELIDSSNKKDLKTDLSAILNGVVDAVKTSNQLDAAERLYGADIRDRLANLLGADSTGFEPQQA